jgi:hypothetical protein
MPQPPNVVTPYRPMTLGDLARHLSATDDEMFRWRLIAEFLEEYRWEPADERPRLLTDEPGSTGDERWDVFLAALAEHLALRDHRREPEWAEDRRLRTLTDETPVLGRGAAMALAYDARRATRDIDALFEPHGVVREEADAVAAELGLPRWWLNDQASVFVAKGGDPDAPSVFENAGIRVAAASPEHLLAMKVLAARRRDVEDIRMLVQPASAEMGVSPPG